MSSRGRGRGRGRKNFSKKYVKKEVKKVIRKDVRKAFQLAGGGKLDMVTRKPAVSYVRKQRSGPLMKYVIPKRLRGKPSGGCTFHYRLSLGTVGFTVTTDEFNFILSAGSSANTRGQFYMWPANAFYFPAMVYNMVRNYEFYRIPRFRVIYRTRYGASINCVLFCSYFPDPNFFEDQTIANATTVLNAPILTSATSCAQWPAWNNMDCKTNSCKKWLYTAGTQLNNAFSFAGTAANDRQTVAGVYGFFGTGNPTPGTATTIGDIYIEMDVETKVMANPQQGTISFAESTSVGSTMHPKAHIRKLLQTEEKLKKLDQLLERLEVSGELKGYGRDELSTNIERTQKKREYLEAVDRLKEGELVEMKPHLVEDEDDWTTDLTPEKLKAEKLSQRTLAHAEDDPGRRVKKSSSQKSTGSGKG